MKYLCFIEFRGIPFVLVESTSNVSTIMLYNSETKGFGLYYIIIQNKNVQEKLYELLVAEHMSSSVKLVALQGTF